MPVRRRHAGLLPRPGQLPDVPARRRREANLLIHETLTRLGLSRTEAGRLLGMSPRTVRRWCEPPGAPNRRDVPEAVWRLLDLIERVPGARERLEARANTPEERR